MMFKWIVFISKYFANRHITVGKNNNSFNWKIGNSRNIFKAVSKSSICWSFIDDISLRRPPEGFLFLFLFISYNQVTNLIFYSSYLMVFKFYSYYTYFNCNQYLWWRVTVAYKKNSDVLFNMHLYGEQGEVYFMSVKRCVSCSVPSAFHSKSPLRNFGYARGVICNSSYMVIIYG